MAVPKHPTLGDVETLTFSQHVRIEPKPQQTRRIKVATPPATEFDVSAAIDILHDQEDLSHGGLKGGWERLHTEDPQAAERFPRHNRVVEKIKAYGSVAKYRDRYSGSLRSGFGVERFGFRGERMVLGAKPKVAVFCFRSTHARKKRVGTVYTHAVDVQ